VGASAPRLRSRSASKRTVERSAPQGFRTMRRGTFAFGTCSCHSFPHPIYLGICTVTCAFVGLTGPCAAGTFRSLRAAGAAESGNRGRDPWESRKADWAHLLVRLGQLTSCAGGEAREAPKPNERVLRPGNQDGCERLLGAPEPEGPTVAGSFGFRRAGGPSGSSLSPPDPGRRPDPHATRALFARRCAATVPRS
jgi:hypothetical protein